MMNIDILYFSEEYARNAPNLFGIQKISPLIKEKTGRWPKIISGTKNLNPDHGYFTVGTPINCKQKSAIKSLSLFFGYVARHEIKTVGQWEHTGICPNSSIPSNYNLLYIRRDMKAISEKGCLLSSHRNPISEFYVTILEGSKLEMFKLIIDCILYDLKNKHDCIG